MTPTDDAPMMSVVIPMRNENEWIERCLASVFQQDYPADRLEVLVVDGMSDDGSYEKLTRLAATEPRLKVLRNPARIVPSSLNKAIEAASGDVVARVDSHTTLASDYLRTGVELLGRTGAENVGGPMVKLGGGPVGDAIAGAMSSRFGIGSYFQFADGEAEADTVYMGMWPRAVFDRVGLFDEELVRNQDDEFNYRLRKSGGRIVVSTRMRSLYQNRRSWKALAKQFFQYGVWKVRVLQKHPRQMSVRHFVPPAFDFAVLGGFAASPWLPAAGALSLGALALYGAVMATVAWQEGPEGNRARFWLALVIIHHCWAAGFLAGMVRFGPRWFRAEPPAKKPSRAFAEPAHGR